MFALWQEVILVTSGLNRVGFPLYAPYILGLGAEFMEGTVFQQFRVKPLKCDIFVKDNIFIYTIE